MSKIVYCPEFCSDEGIGSAGEARDVGAKMRNLTWKTEWSGSFFDSSHVHPGREQGPHAQFTEIDTEKGVVGVNEQGTVDPYDRGVIG